MQPKTIYLDYAATTPVDPRVAAKMQNYLTADGVFGNPASLHAFGLAAKAAVDAARAQVADLIGADSPEIIWTSGATEANNLALKGAVALYQQRGKHIITVKTEHPSVLDCCQQLEKEGFSVTYLTPEKNGLLNLEKLLAAFRKDTVLVSVMHVNNEIGIIQDIQAIGKMTSERGILFHVDAAQSAGKIPIDVNAMHVDLLSLCAHKLYGPKGIGALYVRKKPRIRVAPQIHGGGQERGMRSGTLPTHQIVGMGEACFLAKSAMTAEHQRIMPLRDYFWQRVSILKNTCLNSDLAYSVPEIINIGFAGVTAEKLMQQLPELAFSAGSACQAKEGAPSYVLRALGLSDKEAQCSVRFSFGRFTTEEEVKLAVAQILTL